MALYIVFEDGKERGWHVGQRLALDYKQIAKVSHVQADGDELQQIMKQYFFNTMTAYSQVGSYSIPIPMDQPVVVWFGDIAKGILGNLK